MCYFEGRKMSKILEIVKEFKRKVSEEMGKVEVILFGSHARNSTERESDIDIFVIVEKDVDTKIKEAIYDIAYEISLKYDVVLDVSVYSRTEWEKYRDLLPLIINVEKEGVIV